MKNKWKTSKKDMTIMTKTYEIGTVWQFKKFQKIAIFWDTYDNQITHMTEHIRHYDTYELLWLEKCGDIDLWCPNSQGKCGDFASGKARRDWEIGRLGGVC